MRILIWLIIGLAVVVWIKRALARVAHQGSDGAQAGPVRQRESQSETMLQCGHCGVHFPASEAISGAGGAVYCSAEHRQIAR